jgi:hypothetical protein
VSCGSSVLQQRGACGMAGNAAEGSEQARKGAASEQAACGMPRRGASGAPHARRKQPTHLKEESTVLYGE